MTREDKENLKNKKLTESLIVSCLATCESVISKNAYLEKKWCNCSNSSVGCYYGKRMEWSGYREKLRNVLKHMYSMKQIIQMTKSCTNKATQKAVTEVIGLIDNNDYTLV